MDMKEKFLPFWILKDVLLTLNFNKPPDKRSYEDLFEFSVQHLEFTVQEKELQELFLVWTDLDMDQEQWPPNTEISLNDKKITLPVPHEKGQKKIHIFQAVPIENEIQKKNQIIVKIPEYVNGNIFLLDLRSQSIQDIVKEISQKSSQKISVNHVKGLYSSLKKPDNIPLSKQEEGENEKRITQETVSLLDVLTLQRLEFCVKGKECYHRQPFDLECFLTNILNTYRQNCPICSKFVNISEIFVDYRMNNILKEVKDKSIKKIILKKEGYELIPEKQEKKRVINEIIDISD